MMSDTAVRGRDKSGVSAIFL